MQIVVHPIDLEKDRKGILSRYRKLLRKAKPFLKDDDAKVIKKAFNISAKAHQDMRRKSGEPYIYHPLEVAYICVAEIGLGTTSIVAALLHDVVEDTDWTIEEIEAQFGTKVAIIIDGLTKLSGTFDSGTSQQAENFRKMLLTIAEDLRVILVKLADRLHNMRTLDSMPRNKQLKIASETNYIYAPLAHRLGLYAIKSEMEDLYLRYADRDAYQHVVDKISATKSTRAKFISKFIRPLKEDLKAIGGDFVIKGRPKSIHSIWNKMKKQDIPFEEVYDLFAIRIILDTPLHKEKATCWQIYSIVTDHYKPNPDRLRDWVSTPKSNGYESLHTTVMSDKGQWVEVQIRTKRMDDIAEKGYAAHWKYKGGNSKSKESGLEHWIAQVRDMLEQNDSSALEFVDEFRSNLFNEEVFVFTPKGDLKTLPQGATALDFAFDIHTEVGAKCIGAKVNQILKPINYQLHNGDQLEILTSSKQKPTEDWLRFVVTSKAKSKIKDELKSVKKHVVELGKETLFRKLKQIKLEESSKTFDNLRKYFNVRNQFDLYYKIGKHGLGASELKKFRDNTTRVKPRKVTKKVEDAKSFEKELKKAKGTEHDILLIGEDMDVVDYVMAKCCNPIPGDDVFGFVTVTEGIKIHRTNCPNSTELMSNHGHRVVKAKWTSQHQADFLVNLKVLGTDRVGLINDITTVISNQLKVNMRSLSMTTDMGIFEGTIIVFISDTRHLDRLIHELESVNGVEQVRRFD